MSIKYGTNGELKERYVGYNRLPNLYQEVEYIESDGNAYVNTGILSKNINEIEMDISDIYQGSSYADQYSYIVFGTTASSWWFSSTYYTYNGARFRYHKALTGGPHDDCNAPQTGSINHLIYTRTQFTVNGNVGTQVGTDPSWTNADEYPVCFWYCGNNSHSKYKMYSLKITTTDGEHNYIPCYRKSDDVIGLYSIEDEEFYTNAGTGIFTKGNDVLFKKITEIYIGNGDSTATKIRPSAIEAQFDFRTLSLSDLSSQGRLYDSIARLDSNGFMTNTSSNNYAASLYCPINISEANHVYLKWTGYFISGSWAGGPSFGLNSTNSRDTGYRYIGNLNLNNNSSYKEQSIYLNSANVVAQQIGVSTGDYTIEFDIDLTTGLTTVTRTGPTTFTQSYTLSASELSTLKSGTQYIVTTVGHGVYQAHRVYTMEYLIS